MDIPSHSSVFLPSSAEPFSSTSSPGARLFSLLDDPSSSTTSHIKDVARKNQKGSHTQGESYGHAITINILPDDVLLEIFDFWKNNMQWFSLEGDWHILGHVCRRWRQIVFGSPLRLDLRICCTETTPVRRDLAIWPAFPIAVYYNPAKSRGDDNVIAALEHRDRVGGVRLHIRSSQLGTIATVMQEPFPVLTHLSINVVSGNDRMAPVLPAKFLGGFAHRLQSITFTGIPFPALPTLLLSTSDLVTLSLDRIPPTGYISPEAMVACLTVLSRLKTFLIEFQSALPRPDRIHPPPITRTALPALTTFSFCGANEYLENLVAHIDSPQLYWISIRYLNQLSDIQVAQLSRFINRSIGPVFKRTEVTFSSGEVTFDMYPHEGHRPYGGTYIKCEGDDWRVSHMGQALSQFSATLSKVVHLKLELGKGCQLEGTNDVEWQFLLHQFSTVQTLYVSRKLAGLIALALEDTTGGMAAEVLPSLDLIWLGGQRAPSIKKFVAARRLSGRPVTVIGTKKEFNKRLESYVGK